MITFLFCVQLFDSMHGAKFTLFKYFHVLDQKEVENKEDEMKKFGCWKDADDLNKIAYKNVPQNKWFEWNIATKGIIEH